MSPSTMMIVVASAACLGLAMVLARRSWERNALTPIAPDRPMEMECTVCQRQLVFGTSEVVPLTPAEIALVVRLQPSLVGKKLFEYVCPYCDASHAFIMERRAFKWVAVNSYNPQAAGTRCMECNKPLQRPPWPKGMYDERLHEVPQLRDEYGLVCSRCGARSCVACCKRVSPRRELPYLCPRCHRRPIETFLHF